MDTLLSDLRYATRALRNHPVFALTAMLTLALGIGASTAIFSVVNAVLLRPLPYVQADRLVMIWGELRNRHLLNFPFAPADFRDVREQATLLRDAAAIVSFPQPLGGDGDVPEEVRVAGVTTNFLPLLGVHTTLGRDFHDEDAAPPPRAAQGAAAAANAPPLPAMVILNHAFWARRYGSDPSVLGRTVELGGQHATIVGVLPPNVELLLPREARVDRVPDVFAAMRIDFANASRMDVFMRVVGRLKPGATVAGLQQQVERIAADFRQRYPIDEAAGLHFNVVPLHEDLVSEVRPAIVALMGAVVFVLLIACANVANLLLVRASARERELAVRAALGSSPWRLVRQMLAESVVLAAGSALLGLALAWVGIRVLIALAPASLPRLDAVHIDLLVLGFTVVLSVIAAGLFGLVPAVRASRPNLAEVLRAGRTPGLQGGKLLRNTVVIVEVALSFVLLVGCGLMVRSFIALQRVDPGFDPRGVLTFVARNPYLRTPPEQAVFVRQLRERLLAIPGVKAVTAASPLPLDGQLVNVRWGTEAAIADPSTFQQANAHIVLPGYFAALGTKLIAGRGFTEDDNRDSAKYVIIDQLLAAKAFPNQSAVGKRLLVRSRSDSAEWLEVIGVVQHQRHETLAADGREGLFLTDGFLGAGSVSRWAVRGAGDPAQLVGSVRQVMHDLDPRVPISEVQPMQAFVDRAVAPTRFALALIGVFAVIAAVLAAVGLYGVLSTVVRQRTAEIGVRMAFGAPSTSIFRLVIGEGLRLSAAGILLGAVAALLLTRVMRSMLVGVGATDPSTFAVIVFLFLAIAVLACWVPARRAAGLDPTTALREE